MKLTVAPLLILLFIAIKSFSQQTKEIVEESGEKWTKLKKVYTVLKDDPTIKQGGFEQYWTGQKVITGYYKNNKKDSIWQRYNSRGTVMSRKFFTEGKRTGTWDFLDRNSEIVWQYDFDNNTFKKQPDHTLTYSYQAANGAWIDGKADQDPFVLRSTLEWQSFLNFTLRYPEDAIDRNKMGTVNVEILVDEEGNALDYAVNEHVFEALDKEALRVVKMFEPEFLPAVKDGKKVKAKVKIPITFRLERG